MTIAPALHSKRVLGPCKDLKGLRYVEVPETYPHDGSHFCRQCYTWAGSVDVAKMTCQQFATYKVTNPKFIAIWLNGYHHGTRTDTVVDTQQLDADTRKLQDCCIKNPNTPLMQAVDTVLKQ